MYCMSAHECPPAVAAHSKQSKHWTATSLLELEASAVRHDVSKLVTIVKRDGEIHMTTLRKQFAAFSAQAQNHTQKVVREETFSFMAQLRHIFESFAATDSTSTTTPKLIHYPFGGTDVANVLALSKATRCVVFASAEKFASSAQQLSNDLCKLLQGSAYIRKGAGATLFDAHDDFEHLHDELGLCGVGAMAIVRLLGPMARLIDLVCFFELSPDGNICFAPPHAAATSRSSHVLLGVQSRTDVPRQLLWFVHHNIHSEDAGVDAFFGRLHPDILLIKAAPDSLWQGGKAAASTASLRRCLHRSLSPAHAANAIVVTDSSQADPHTPPAIFRDKHQVKSVVFGGAQKTTEHSLFGYGHRVFCSRGLNLISNKASVHSLATQPDHPQTLAQHKGSRRAPPPQQQSLAEADERLNRWSLLPTLALRVTLFRLILGELCVPRAVAVHRFATVCSAWRLIAWDERLWQWLVEDAWPFVGLYYKAEDTRDLMAAATGSSGVVCWRSVYKYLAVGNTHRNCRSGSTKLRRIFCWMATDSLTAVLLLRSTMVMDRSVNSNVKANRYIK